MPPSSLARPKFHCARVQRALPRGVVEEQWTASDDAGES